MTGRFSYVTNYYELIHVCLSKAPLGKGVARDTQSPSKAPFPKVPPLGKCPKDKGRFPC